MSVLRWKHISKAGLIRGLRYPADFDIENVDFAGSGKDISGSDFRLVKGLRWERIKDLDIVGLKYPADFDVEQADFREKIISGSDFRFVKGYGTIKIVVQKWA